jgi:hypothetical protein
LAYFYFTKATTTKPNDAKRKTIVNFEKQLAFLPNYTAIE